jgi:hypothetical protein
MSTDISPQKSTDNTSPQIQTHSEIYKRGCRKNADLKGILSFPLGRKNKLRMESKLKLERYSIMLSVTLFLDNNSHISRNVTPLIHKVKPAYYGTARKKAFPSLEGSI